MTLSRKSTLSNLRAGLGLCAVTVAAAVLGLSCKLEPTHTFSAAACGTDQVLVAAVAAAADSASGRQIAAVLAGQLHHERQQGLAAGLNADAVIREQLKRVCGQGCVAEPHDVEFRGIDRITPGERRQGRVLLRDLDAGDSVFEHRSHVGLSLGDWQGPVHAIDDAPGDAERSRAARTMAMSYAFERNCEGATKCAGPLYDRNLAAGAFFDAGEVANELARVCLESGSLDQAETWYKRGYEAGLREESIKPERRDLWQFRWEHAQARLAARRGQAEQARKHVAAAKTVLDKGTNPEQAPFFPYLVGYVAFYTGDMATAIAELQKGNQNDPFIQCLLAQAYEKQGDKVKADELYRKVLTSTAHNPTNAYARPIAKRKLGMK